MGEVPHYWCQYCNNLYNEWTMTWTELGLYKCRTCAGTSTVVPIKRGPLPQQDSVTESWGN